MRAWCTARTARCGCAPIPLPIDSRAVQAVAARERVAEFEEELLRRRRDHLILRVDRADLSKNVLRGFGAFDVFLQQHPEFRERVTFIAQLMPSRTDVPEYAEYLERIEAVVAVVNHRHGSPDWMPIQLKLRDDLEEAVAAYKHYDVLIVNAMFDGMNLVAKEGPMVNDRAGVSILSENTGAHEELGEYALSVNPFDIQELADSIHAALTMPQRGARAAAGRAAFGGHRARPGRLDRRAAGRHPAQGRCRRLGIGVAVASRCARGAGAQASQARSVVRPALGQHRHELLDAPRPRLRAAWRPGSGRGSCSGGCPRVAKNSLAAGFSRAPAGSPRGSLAVTAARRRPPTGRRCLAASTWARPAGVIRPCSISLVALSRLICDHLLRGRRGVKRWRKKARRAGALWPSIQP